VQLAAFVATGMASSQIERFGKIGVAGFGIRRFMHLRADLASGFGQPAPAVNFTRETMPLCRGKP